MALSEDQQLEMYSDIKVIKNNCIGCAKRITQLEKENDDLKKRVSALEKFQLIVMTICGFIGTLIGFALKVFKG